MAGFLYFLDETRTGQVRSVLPQRGLGHVVSPGLRSCGANDGPGGVAGIVVGGRDRVESKDVAYRPELQTWRRVPGHDGAWVGFLNACPPGPADLERKRMVDGRDVELGDGTLWHVPVAICWDGPPMVACGRLPCAMDVSDAGDWIYGDVVPAYRHLWDLAKEWSQARAHVSDHLDQHGSTNGLDDPRLENDWICGKSAEVLGANYVIGPAEAALLGLFVSGRKWDVLDALIDAQGFVDIVSAAASDSAEKKTDDTPSTTPG